MIGWMQKHKKWLVITIWVSGIAFIGAGMVGFGAYSYGGHSDRVAQVGDIEIRANKLNREYSRLYQNYNALMNGELDEAEAKNMGLDKIALETLVSQALFQNLALDMGIRVGDEEVLKEIVKMEEFATGGIFDDKKYKDILRNNNLTPSEFEEDVRGSILMQKLASMFPLSLTESEIEAFGAIDNIQDRIEVLVLDSKNMKPEIKEEEIKGFWEKNKNSFTDPSEFTIDIVSVDIDSTKVEESDIDKFYEENRGSFFVDGQEQVDAKTKNREAIIEGVKKELAESKALREFVALKKAQDKYGEVITIKEDDNRFAEELMAELKNSKNGDTLRPAESDKKFVVIKLLNRKDSLPQSYEIAKDSVAKILTQTKKRELLGSEAKAKMTIFKGNDIGFISPSSNRIIPQLNLDESRNFMANLFVSGKRNGYVIVGDKAVLYRILEQKLLKKGDVGFVQPPEYERIVQNAKGVYLDKTIVDYLGKKYRVTNYMRSE